MHKPAYLTLLATAVAVLALGGEAWGQSIYGPGGLFLNPTAAVPPKGQLTPAVLMTPQTIPALGGRRTAWYSYTLDYGATDRLEVGGTYLKATPGLPPFENGSAGAFAKYRLVDGKVGGRPDVAIGGSFLSGGDLNAKVVFAATRFTPRLNTRYPAHIHAGLIYADRLNQLQRHNTVPYGGVDVGLSQTLLLFGEMRAAATKPAGAGDEKPPSAVGLLWQPSSTLKLVVAYADNGWGASHQFSVGIGFTIGTRR